MKKILISLILVLSVVGCRSTPPAKFAEDIIFPSEEGVDEFDLHTPHSEDERRGLYETMTELDVTKIYPEPEISVKKNPIPKPKEWEMRRLYYACMIRSAPSIKAKIIKVIRHTGIYLKVKRHGRYWFKSKSGFMSLQCFTK